MDGRAAAVDLASTYREPDELPALGRGEPRADRPGGEQALSTSGIQTAASSEMGKDQHSDERSVLARLRLSEFAARAEESVDRGIIMG